MTVVTKFDEKNLQLEEQRFRVLESLDKFRQLVGVDEAKFTDSLKGAFGVNSAHKLNWDQIGIAFSVLEKIHSDGGTDFCEASFSEASQPGFSADLTLKV
ncbi:hypothetical protein HTZ97_09360 [Desulfuromonas acetoxidans]|uniref:Uncharacterized protein n=1 Tax=Desulfuromonas acetoxidans (strain DSM 684 / 11070) TaxID=281689 RepID=Q1JYR4_DESA6|nr:hypothetical protein [Desulfuromonas acetoxidans]EAT15351.1 hypothetical protein Dace_1015 [Desulfuromonas acetoxidans DSM 684]MBF0646405.1 hypothetical protein [Desulfuromonas acetoxidans]NVD24380.1 hypothetical protein [Desulfuromonas acetoxidans]NVE16672.1 hypothetical protein [Desulfuromonas acetoxidans]